MTILLATDGSTHSEAALETAKQLPLPGDTHAIVLSVVHSEDSVTTSLYFDPFTEQGRRYELMSEEETRAAVRRIEVAAEQLQDKGWRIEGMVRYGHPAEQVLKASVETLPDLLIVGSRGLGTFKGWLLGSVSHALVASARCSVLVVRPSNQVPAGRSRVLLATDGSRDSVAACGAIARFHLAEGCDLRVLNVVHRLTSTGLGMAVTQFAGSIVADELAGAEAYVAGVAESLRSYCAEVGTEVRVGSPADEIMESARVWRADLIVVGSKGHSALEAFLIGSVSQKIATYAPCSVLVARGGGAVK